MPQLGLSNSTSKSKQRNPIVAGQENFDLDTGGFTGEDANLALYSTGLDTPCLQVDCTQANGYAYKEFTVTASTKYYWRVKLVVGEVGSGNKSILWGTSAGDGTHYAATQNVPGVTSSGTFTTGGSQTSVFLSLKQAQSGKFAGWDDVLIEEANV